MTAGGMDYMKLRPPASTKSYKSADKLVALEQLDVHTVLQIINPTDREFEVMRLGAAIVGAVGAYRGRKSAFPSPCDLIDVDMRGYSSWDDPAWRSRVASHRSIWMLRGVDRLRRLLAKRNRARDRYARLECPECHEKTVGVSVGPKVEFNGSRATLGRSSAMVHLIVDCDCRGITAYDIYEFEREALLACGC